MGLCSLLSDEVPAFPVVEERPCESFVKIVSCANTALAVIGERVSFLENAVTFVMRFFRI